MNGRGTWKGRLLSAWLLVTLIAVACGGGDGDDVAEPGSIGVEGGVVISDDGRLSLSIPPSALADSHAISVEAVAEAQRPGDLAAVAPRAVFSLRPDGLEFAEPVPFTLDVDVEISEDGVATPPVVLVRNAEGEYEAVDVDVRIDLESETATVTGTIDHFSWVVAFDGNLTVGLQKIEPTTRAVGSEWTAFVRFTNTSDVSEIDVGSIEFLAEGAVGVAGLDRTSGFALGSGDMSQIGDDPTEEPDGRWECAEPGPGFYGVSVSATGLLPSSGADRFGVGGFNVEVFVAVECVAAPSTGTTGNTTQEETTSDNQTTEETTTSIEVPATCEEIIGGEPTPAPCGADLPGSSVLVEFTGDALPAVTFRCEPDCGDPAELGFHQYQVETWLGDDRAILCDDDPAFPCSYTNMQTFEVLSPEAEGISVPERVVIDDGVAIELRGPWGFNADSGRFEIGGVSITQFIIQWWYGEEPTKSDIAVVTISGDDLDELSEQLEEWGEVTVEGGAFGQ